MNKATRPKLISIISFSFVTTIYNHVLHNLPDLPLRLSSSIPTSCLHFSQLSKVFDLPFLSLWCRYISRLGCFLSWCAPHSRNLLYKEPAISPVSLPLRHLFQIFIISRSIFLPHALVLANTKVIYFWENIQRFFTFVVVLFHYSTLDVLFS